MAGKVKAYLKRFLKRTGIRKGLIGGVLILLVVDVLWVGSAALSRFLFTEESYPKPLFTTYFKTSLFSIYLTAFVFWRPWQRLCMRGCTKKRKSGDVRGRVASQDDERDPLLSPDSDTCDTDINDNHTNISQDSNPVYTESFDNQTQQRHYSTFDCTIGPNTNQPSSEYIQTDGTTQQATEGDHNNMVLDCESNDAVPQIFHGTTDDNQNQSVEEFKDFDQNSTRIDGMDDNLESVASAVCAQLDTDLTDNTACTEALILHRNVNRSDPTDSVCDIHDEDHNLDSQLETSNQSNALHSDDVHTNTSVEPPITSCMDVTTTCETESTSVTLVQADGSSQLSFPTHREGEVDRPVCPFADYLKDGQLVPAKPVGEDSSQSGTTYLTFRGARSGSINGDSRIISCPLNPELKICLLGPPEIEPLGCYETDSTDDEREPTQPLSPCHDKCCKVRFKPTVEVREVKGQGTSVRARRRLFKKYHHSRHKEKWKKKHELLSVAKVALLAAIFGIVWFFANYLYAIALNVTSVAAVNTLSSMSGVFVMVLAAVPFLSVTEGDKLTLSRCLVTLASVCGAILVSLSPSGDDDDEGSKFNFGAVYALGGSVLYAVYLVLLRRVVTDHDSLDIPMFFGFVGLFDAILLLPLVTVWHVTGLETFELPPTADIWTLLLVNGFVGTVLSELLWLWGVFLTSPLLGTLALSLVTPLSLAYSIVIGKAMFSWMFLSGAVLILLAFIGVTVLDHYGAWDPLWTLIKKLFVRARDIRSHREFRGLSPESRLLITSNDVTHNYCQDYMSP